MPLRKIANSDRALLDGWVKNDPHHRDILSADFFYPLSIVVLDGEYVSMFVKLVPAKPYMRLYVQFGPDEKRVARGMIKNWFKFRESIEETGAEGIIFDTSNSKLARFCGRAFGFKPVGNGDYLLLFREAT